VVDTAGAGEEESEDEGEYGSEGEEGGEDDSQMGSEEK
jgi:hypothetical protein